MAKYRLVPGRSEFSLDELSSVHPLHTATTEMEGYFEAKILANGKLDPAVAPTGRLEVFLENLETGNKLYDREMQRRLKTRRFPSIIAEVIKMRPTNEPGHFQAVGDLTFQGVTRRFENTVTMTLIDDRTIEIRGEIIFDIRDFNIEPPQFLMLKVHPVIKATLRAVAEWQG